MSTPHSPSAASLSILTDYFRVRNRKLRNGRNGRCVNVSDVLAEIQNHKAGRI